MKNRKPLLTPEEAAYIAGAAPSATGAAAAGPVEAEKLVRFTVDLPEALHRRLKVAAMDRRQPMTKAAQQAITNWLDSLNS
jgi:hypothetical protein